MLTGPTRASLAGCSAYTCFTDFGAGPYKWISYASFLPELNLRPIQCNMVEVCVVSHSVTHSLVILILQYFVAQLILQYFVAQTFLKRCPYDPFHRSHYSFKFLIMQVWLWVSIWLLHGSYTAPTWLLYGFNMAPKWLLYGFVLG